MDPDFRVHHDGSVSVLVPVSSAAQVWVEECVQSEPWQWLGAGLVIEHRYIDLITGGARDEGFTVEED